MLSPIIILLALLAAIALAVSYLKPTPSTLALRKPAIVVLLGCLIVYLARAAGIL